MGLMNITIFRHSDCPCRMEEDTARCRPQVDLTDLLQDWETRPWVWLHESVQALVPAPTAEPVSKCPQQTRSVLCPSVFPVDAPPPFPHQPCWSPGGLQWFLNECRSPSENSPGVGCGHLLQHGWRVPELPKMLQKGIYFHIYISFWLYEI